MRTDWKVVQSMKGEIIKIWKRGFLVGLALVSGIQLAQSQGTVSMSNLSGTRVNAPVSGPDGDRLSGSRYKAQLVAGPTEGSMEPFGKPVSFENGLTAGYFFGPVVEISSVNPGEVAFVAIRAWDTRNGRTTYSRATTRGMSNVIEVQTGGAVLNGPPA